MPVRMNGKLVIVTGAGGGLGAAYALLLARLGARVVVNDIGVAKDGRSQVSNGASSLVEEIVGQGGDAVADGHDVSTEEGARGLIRTAVRRYGRIDGLVNNAGILRSGRLVDLEVEDWDAVHRVHLRGSFLTMRETARWWREQAAEGNPVEASIVNTTSSAGLRGFWGEAAYSAAKAGVVGLSLTASAELRKLGVRVNAVAPVARTRMTDWMPHHEGEDRDDPLAPEHVAPVVAWLVGDPPVSGRVVEVGNGTIAVSEGWKLGARTEVAGHLDAEDAGRLLMDLFERTPQPPKVMHPAELVSGSRIVATE